MNKRIATFGYMAAMLGMAALSFGQNDVYADVEPRTPTPRPEPKSIDEDLAAKGLQRFIINGEKIIAKNEREAQKRYNHRHKK